MTIYVVHYISTFTGRMEVGNAFESNNDAWKELEEKYGGHGEVVCRVVC